MIKQQKSNMSKSFQWFLLMALLAGQCRYLIAAENPVTIISTKVICKEPDRYIGWPTIVKRQSGQLIAVFSGDRDAHVCPWGKTEMISSPDNGKTWTKPSIINNTPLDDRDAGIIETKKGTLLVSWFTSLGFEEYSDNWDRHAEKITPEIRRQWLGSWIRRSEDGGKTWGDPVRTIACSPHGPVQLNDGRLLHIGTATLDEKPAIAAEASSDDGKTWQLIGTVPVPERTVDSLWFCEPHLVEVGSGKLLAMFRVEPKVSEQFLYQAESSDGGRTWSAPHKTPIWGFPPHLTRLNNGWILVTYGRRKAPFGERACISRDNGKTWDIDNEITLCNALSSDLGYPASVQLNDGSIMTVYYQQTEPGEKTCLMAAHWRLNE